jgi:hypothetical protein
MPTDPHPHSEYPDAEGSKGTRIGHLPIGYQQLF